MLYLRNDLIDNFFLFSFFHYIEMGCAESTVEEQTYTLRNKFSKPDRKGKDHAENTIEENFTSLDVDLEQHEISKIQETLTKHFLFTSLDTESILEVAKAFKKCSCEK